MKKYYNRIIILFVLIGVSINPAFAQKTSPIKVKYVCTPCGIKCDKEVFDTLGECPNCKMKLVDKKSVTHKSVSPTALSKFIKSTKNLYVLDVRTKEEFEGHGEPDFGTLKNSVNIPISELENCEFV